jgi:hypothetical protein
MTFRLQEKDPVDEVLKFLLALPGGFEGHFDFATAAPFLARIHPEMAHFVNQPLWV